MDDIMKNNAVRRGQHVLPLLAISLLTVCAFLPTFRNGFQMEWDDQWMVMNPLTVLYLNWSSVVEIFCTPFNGQWAPFNQMLYTLLYNLFEYNPFPYHAASLLMHLINVWLVYIILWRLLRDRASLSEYRTYAIVVIATALFAIHPLQVEAVAWISASKILMSATFYLLATYMFILYLTGRRRIFYVATLLMYLCSYLSKENVMTFPLWASLLSIMYGRRVREKEFWMINVPIYLQTLAMSLHLVFWVSGYDDYIQGDVYPWWQRAVFCFYSLFNYAYYWMLPFRLDWMYSFPIELHGRLPWWLLLYPILLLAIVYAAWGRVKSRPVICALLFSSIHLLFVVHLIVLPREGVIADRYMYLPIMGLNVLLAYYLMGWSWAIACKRLSAGLCIVVMLLLTALSYERTLDWKDSKTLKKENVIDM